MSMGTIWYRHALTACRRLRRKPGHTITNILCLSVAIAVCVSVGLVVKEKLSYDKSYEDSDRIFRVLLDPVPELNIGTPLVPRGLAQRVATGVPGVQEVVGVFRKEKSLVSGNDRKIYSDRVFSVDSSFFDVFSSDLVSGDQNTALSEPGQIVLSADFSEQLFDGANPLGSILTVERSGVAEQYVVSGVLDGPPPNSHWQYDALATLSTSESERRYAHAIQWGAFDHYLYLRLQSDAAIPGARTAVEAIEPFIHLQKIEDIHLYSGSSLNGEIGPQSDIRYIYLLVLIAIGTLIIASMNYVNVSVASGLGRSREIGIRKALGAGKGEIIAQSIGETILVALLALPLAILISIYSVRFLNSAVGGTIEVSVLGQWDLWLGLSLAMIGVGVVAGSYPAFVLSSFDPREVLYGKVSQSGTTATGIARALVALQLAISSALILGVLVMNSQLGLIQESRIGSEERLILLEGDVVSDQSAQTFKQELLNQLHVIGVATGLPPGLDYGGLGGLEVDGAEGIVWMKRIRGDADYIPTLGIRLIQGENFSEEGPEDQGYIVNETAADLLHITAADVGTRIDYGSWEGMLIRGIMADFHHRTLHDPIQPLYMHKTSVSEAGRAYFLVRLSEANLSEGVSEVAEVWSEFVPDRPFDFRFLGDEMAALYQTERRFASLFGAFSILAIVIGAIGMFGLSSFIATRRTKEIGIRKSLGATTSQIIMRLSWDLLKPAAWGALATMPLAYFVIDSWLDDFAYRVNVSWANVGISLSVVLCIAVTALVYHVVVTSRLNPATTLRDE